MKVDLLSLNSQKVKYIDINETYSFTKEELAKSEIEKLDNVRINGYITKNDFGDYEINITVKGTMTLPCSVSLKPVDYPFSTKIEGNIEKIYEEIGEKFKKGQKTLDIFPIIWENILMEIPMRVVSDDLSDVEVKGNGWELIQDKD